MSEFKRPPGVKGLERYETAIYGWWADNKHKLDRGLERLAPDRLSCWSDTCPATAYKKSPDETEIEMGELIAQLETSLGSFENNAALLVPRVGATGLQHKMAF